MEQSVPSDVARGPVNTEAYSSGVSWAAVVAGAFVTAALALVLLALGAGFGLSSVSPWSHTGAPGSAIGKVAIAWLIITQILASAMGGYLAGRLRTRWATIHTDEVYFRDTAHGFLVWAVGLVIAAAFLASAATSMVGGARQVGATMATGASVQTADGRTHDPNSYFVDALFRSERPTSDANDVSQRAEAGRILANAVTQEDVPAADRTYLTRLVAAKTGLSQTEAEKRVSATIVRAKTVADNARKAAAHSLLWIFVALMIGAFCASYAATLGGKQRDHVKLT